MGFKFEDLMIPRQYYYTDNSPFKIEATYSLDPHYFQQITSPSITLKTGGKSMAPKTVSYTKVKKGDTINVRYDNEVVSGVSTEKGITFVETANGKFTYAGNNGHPAIFEMVKEGIPTPANWPPALNDVWEATDTYGTEVLYHAKKNGNLVRLDTDTTFTSSPKDVLEAFNGKLTLKFRPGLSVCSVV